MIDAFSEHYGILLNNPSIHGFSNNKNALIVTPRSFQLILTGGAFFLKSRRVGLRIHLLRRVCLKCIHFSLQIKKLSNI